MASLKVPVPTLVASRMEIEHFFGVLLYLSIAKDMIQISHGTDS
jgi:hypothetical protein